MDLYKKYGNYNLDGYFIESHERWDYYARRPVLYRRRKFYAYCWCLVPIAGFVVANQIFADMGLSMI